MADGLDTVILSEVEHSVEAGAHGNTARIGLGDSERAELLAVHLLDLVCLGIVDIVGTSEEPVHSV